MSACVRLTCWTKHTYHPVFTGVESSAMYMEVLSKWWRRHLSAGQWLIQNQLGGSSEHAEHSDRSAC